MADVIRARPEFPTLFGKGTDRSTAKSLCERAVDLGLEFFKRKSAAQEHAIDEEGGCAFHASFAAFFHVVFHDGSFRSSGQAGIEFVAIEAQFSSRVFERRFVERALVVKHPVVHFPEFALVVSALTGLGSFLGFVVKAQRKVAENDAHFVAVFREDFFHDFATLTAVWALEVGKLDDGDFGVLGTFGWTGSGNLDLRRGQKNLDARATFDFFDDLTDGALPVLAGQTFDERVLHLLKGLRRELGREPRFVFLEKLARSLDGNFGHTFFDLLFDESLFAQACFLGLGLEHALADHVLERPFAQFKQLATCGFVELLERDALRADHGDDCLTGDSACDGTS